MLPPIPNLQDYDVSPVTGFLPETGIVERLSDPYYQPWETLAQNLPSFVMTRQIRNYVDNKLPLLSTDKLKTEGEWQRACSILGFIAHAYVWAGDKPRDHLPRQIADPWVETSNHFDLPAIATYAGTCLWNFKTIFPGIPPEEWSLENLATLTTVTGSYDESWFYLVSTVIERQGAPCLAHGLDAIKACREGDSESVVKHLQTFAETIDELTTTLARMFEMCDPHTFYFRIRPYLAGWKNMAEAGLPRGVRYGDSPEYRQISGGSNAQSSLIQALDILLNVKHYPTGHRKSTNGILPTQTPPASSNAAKSSESKSNFIHEMRKYMPIKHREFLEDLTKVAHIRDYVLKHAEETPALVISYDACLAMLRNFRDKHIQIVSRYIIIQARKAKKAATPATESSTAAAAAPESGTVRQGLATAKSSKGTPRGTGGTALIPFLKQARDETGDPAASSWGRRLLSDSSGVLENPNTIPVVPSSEIRRELEQMNNSSNTTAGKKDSEESQSAFSRFKHAVLGA